MKARAPLRAYIAGIYVTVACCVAALVVVDPRLERAWLAPVVAALLAASHLGEKRLLRSGGQGETLSHEETYVVLLALLASPLVGTVGFAAGYTLGSWIVRRDRVKAVFNVGVMSLSATVSLLASDALGGGESSSPRGVAAALVAAAIFYATNRLLVAGVFAIVGAASFRESVLDDFLAQLVIAAADASLGLLAALAALDRMWTLPFSLAALTGVHYALSGHVAARAERQKLAEIVNSSSDGIVSVARNRRVVAWNPATEALTGYAADEVLGSQLDDVSRRLEVDADDLLRPAGSGESIVLVRTKSGQRRWLGVSRSATPEGGEVLVLRDETRRRELEALRATEESERLRADLVAAVSHELRTPLASILGFTQTLLGHELAPAERRQYLEIVREQAERLRRLIDDLLDLRLVARGVASDEVFDLRELLREQVDEFRAQAQGHRLSLTLPEEGLTVGADRARLRQVLSNLLSNAVKYSPGGGPIEIRGSHVKGHVRVAVRDHGLGIPADQQSHVFERFFRVERGEGAEIAGTGLGLALAREIVRAHGGEIRLESVEGEGSTFSFDLPAFGHRPAAAEPQQAR